MYKNYKTKDSRMDGEFASNGNAWTMGDAFWLGADDAAVPMRALDSLSREALEHMYNNEMRSRRAAGNAEAHTLTSTWKRKPKSTIVALVQALLDEGAVLRLPPTLNRASRPTLPIGTLLHARQGYSNREDRVFAVVRSVTKSGMLRLGVFKSTCVETTANGPYITRRYRRDTQIGHQVNASFEPSPAPRSDAEAAAANYWTLRSKSSYAHDHRWQLVGDDEQADATVEWTVTSSSLD